MFKNEEHFLFFSFFAKNRMQLESKQVIEAIKNPFQRFFRIEASGGIVLLIFTLIALIWANSPLGKYYDQLWESPLTIGIGNFVLSKTLIHWINDGLMAIFFFVVGLEIKRELRVGELSSARQAALPIIAAIGGMLFPAVIFLLVNKDPVTKAGWGIPMATDIAFSLGVLSLLGKRVPLSLKIFLVAFAIVDDLGAVLVIAVFYSAGIQWSYLLIGLGLFLLLVILNRLRMRITHIYMAVGWIIWYMFLKSGVHPTIAGVLIAFTIPISRKIKLITFYKRMDDNLVQFCEGVEKSTSLTLSNKQLVAIDNMEDEIEHVQSPVQRLEHTLHGFVTFIVMPVFALSNAGVDLLHMEHFRDLFHSLSGHIELSLVVGKVAGIFLFTWLSVKTGIALLPANVRWVHILGLGFLGGMGFTMSLFISNLAFTQATLLNPAKIGILVGSLFAGIIGYFLLRSTLITVPEEKKK